MTLHLIKLSVGSTSVSDLACWQQQRLQRTSELVHMTRQTPKRAAELLDGGSIYWVIQGWICVRQELLEIRPLLQEGVPHCELVYRPEIIRTAPRRHRPFQGWRYFAAEAAPRDLAMDEHDEAADTLRKELSELGLL